ncbi:MAG: hypothetical protein HY401_04680 [Elusimicrobia bacterium]|nr:hypothetical protein [Elusimicrobiota bacterium]
MKQTGFFFRLTLICVALSCTAAGHAAVVISSIPIEAIGIYGAPDDAYPFIRELGIDTIEINTTGKTPEEVFPLLDKPLADGVKVFLNISISSLESTKLLPKINSLKNHAGISYWHLIDRPELLGTDPDMIREFGNFIHLSDQQRRPTLITISDPRAIKRPRYGAPYSAYKKSADILAVFVPAGSGQARILFQSYILPELKGERWWAIVPVNQKPKELKKTIALLAEGKPSGVIYFPFKDEVKKFDLREKLDLQKALTEINYALRGTPLPAPNPSDGPSAFLVLPASPAAVTNTVSPAPVLSQQQSSVPPPFTPPPIANPAPNGSPPGWLPPQPPAEFQNSHQTPLSSPENSSQAETSTATQSYQPSPFRPSPGGWRR